MKIHFPQHYNLKSFQPLTDILGSWVTTIWVRVKLDYLILIFIEFHLKYTRTINKIYGIKYGIPDKIGCSEIKEPVAQIIVVICNMYNSTESMTFNELSTLLKYQLFYHFFSLCYFKLRKYCYPP